MKILIAGGSGFVGRALCPFLLKNRHEVSILTRSPNKTHQEGIQILEWDGHHIESNDSFDIIINLCGHDISTARWSKRTKTKILHSRLYPTQAIVRYIKDHPTTQFIQASGIGYYTCSAHVQDEEQYITPPPATFLHQLCEQIDPAALQAQTYGTQVLLLRMGIVLGRTGGIIGKLAPLYKLGLGTVMGSPQNMVSWIHIDDLCSAIHFLMEHKLKQETCNLTSPNACSQLVFSNTLAHTLNKPRILRINDYLINILFGQMGNELLLDNHNIYPRFLINKGFNFKYPTINEAIKQLFSH